MNTTYYLDKCVTGSINTLFNNPSDDNLIFVNMLLLLPSLTALPSIRHQNYIFLIVMFSFNIIVFKGILLFFTISKTFIYQSWSQCLIYYNYVLWTIPDHKTVLIIYWFLCLGKYIYIHVRYKCNIYGVCTYI